AHAAVYMMRLVGIPARIATGYLTDMRYAKDAHILLHLGDRHAWPEVYVQGHGWVTIDVSPEQAENEPALIPDEKLLEELMSKIDPAEELPGFEDPQPDQSKKYEDLLSHIVGPKTLQTIFAILLALFILAKTWVRFGYLLYFNSQKRTEAAYRSAASLL